ncbi:MAG: ribonuclease Z [Clostridiales bacterium]|jgi:ribonuclease Z|nr:ribonuclease Z [Clostridiales bacterium]
MMDICLLGTGGMMPLHNRYLTALLCRYKGNMVLIDCGEGTQVTLNLQGWGFKSIDAICFTHYHADHISGLPGLLWAISNAGRTEEITIYGPPELERILTGLLVIAYDLGFPIKIVELEYREYNEMPIPGTEMFLSCLPLKHGKPCFAYSISTKRGGKFDLERAEALNLPKRLWGELQGGNEALFEGRRYTPDMVLGPEREGFKIAYCTDTRPVKTIPAFINGADLFICEGLYGDPEKAERARSHMHMIYQEAARLAREGDVKALWLTHYSPAMINPKEFLGVARAIFPGAAAGYDRITKTLDFGD